MNTENVAVENTEVAATVAATFKDKVIGFASNTRNQQVAAVAGGAAVAGLLVWGAKKLYDRHQAKKAVVEMTAAGEALVGEVLTAAQA